MKIKASFFEITEADLVKGLRTEGGKSSVSRFMRAQIPTAAPDEPLYTAQQCMAESRIRTIPVVDQNGRLIGLLATADASEAYRLRSAGLKFAPSPQ